MRAACAARLLFPVPPIKFLICGVVVAVDAIDDAKIGSLSKDDGNGNANARKQ